MKGDTMFLIKMKLAAGAIIMTMGTIVMCKYIMDRQQPRKRVDVHHHYHRR